MKNLYMLINFLAYYLITSKGYKFLNAVHNINVAMYDKMLIGNLLKIKQSRDISVYSISTSSEKSMLPPLPEKIQAAKNSRDLKKFTQLLKSYSVQYSSQNNANFPMVITLHLNEMLDLIESTKECVPDLLWSLGRVGAKSSYIEQKNLTIKLLQYLVKLHPVNARQVVTALTGTVKIRLRITDLPVELRGSLLKLVSKVAAKLNDCEVGNLLHSLGKLSVKWIDLPTSTQIDILSSFQFHAKNLKNQPGVMSIYSFGLLDIPFHTLPPEILSNILYVSSKVFSEVNNEINKQQIANTVYGLAKLGFKYQVSLPPQSEKDIINALNRWLITMNEQEVANSIYSLGIMGFSWKMLPDHFKQTIILTLTDRMSKMITQGFTNSMYGLGLMAADWTSLGTPLHVAISEACISHFDKRYANYQKKGTSSNAPSPGSSGQSITNTIYALGLCGAKWHELDPDMTNVLMDGVVDLAPLMIPQECANILYGLGMMRASYYTLKENVKEILGRHFTRLVPVMSQQEFCSSLHGYAKMGSTWNSFPDSIKEVVYQSFIEKEQVGKLCLACTLYSLGTMGASWEELPIEIKAVISHSAETNTIHEQIMANCAYGLALLGAQWDKLDENLRNVFKKYLNDPKTFESGIGQNIANTIWGLGKMDVHWDEIVSENLISSIIKSTPNMDAQEASNFIYGLAIMDCSWYDLPPDLQEAISKLIVKRADGMATQEVANLMYSFSLMTYDVFTRESPHSLSYQMLLRLFSVVITMFQRLSPSEFAMENYDQFAIFFEFIDSIPEGRKLVEIAYKGRDSPRISGPAGAVPSRLHSAVVEAMHDFLLSRDEKYSVFYEFNGLNGPFPMDTAIYYDDQLIGFVEVDGDFHYRQSGTHLRRKDRLKEYLYKLKYDLPVFRIRSEQVKLIGVENTGKALATWIISSQK